MAEIAGTIKEFLVGIGFKVDEGSYGKMSNALSSMTLKAVELGAEIEGAAVAVVGAVATVADAMEKLYFASARTNTSVENIQAFSFAVSQMGGTAQGAQQSLENLGNFLRSSPAAASLINGLGVKTTDANGKPRDESDIMSDLGAKFASMPIYRAKAYADRLGIDQNTLFAMINGLGSLTTAYKQMYAAAGLDSTGGSSQARGMMVQLRTLGAAFEILGIKVEASLSGAIGGDIEQFRQLLVANFGNIATVIDVVAKAFIILSTLLLGVFQEAFVVLEQLYKAFRQLSPQTQQWIEILLGLITVWRLLNTAFLSSPIGRILALGSALLLLYQDYETWKAGGKSLIDWSKWEPDIERFEDFLRRAWNLINNLVQAIGGWQVVFGIFLTYFAVTWTAGILFGLGSILAKIMLVGRAMATLGGGSAAAATTATEAAGGGLMAGAGGALLRLGGGAGAALGMFFGNPFGMYGGQEAEYKEEDDLGHFDFQPQKGPGASPQGKQIRDLLMTKYGWSATAADGIVSNMSSETGGTFNPASIGDGGAAYGIGQWHKDRQDAFQKLFGKPIQGSSLGEQIAFYNAELKGKTDDRGAAHAGYLLARPDESAQQAGSDVSQYDERPADVFGNMASRGANAQKSGQVWGDKPAATVVVQQHNDTKITVANNTTASQLADHQSRVNKTNARNLQTAVNRAT
jgi:hypothetical protein